MNKMMKSLIGGIAALVLTSAGNALAAGVVTIATGAPGSLAYNSGQAVAKIANEAGIVARTQPLVGYLPLLDTGEIDFGFSNGVEAAFAMKGTGNYTRATPNIRLVGTMFPLRTGIMVPADLGIRTIKDLKAKAGKLRIASEYTSSTIIPYYIAGELANGGMTYDDFKKVPVASFVDGIKALGDGLVDIALVSLNSGAAKEAEVKLKDRGGLQYISLDNSPEGIAALKRYLPAANIISMPKNDNIPGLQNAANIIEIPWMMLASSKTSDDLVYKMTKAIAENKAALKASFGAFGLANKETMAPGNAVPYHPGALRYYKEAGIPVGQ